MDELREALRGRGKVNLAMIAVNIAVYIVLEILGDTEDAGFMAMHGACYPPFVLEGGYWRLFTAMFLHFGFTHLANNMVSLFFLGDILERSLGPVRYLAVYLLGGLAGNVLSLSVSVRSGSFSVSAGASGAIFAVTGALLYVALRNRRIFGQNNMRRMGLMVVLMILQGAVDRGVDNAAHIGGLIGGFLLGILLYHKKSRYVEAPWL